MASRFIIGKGELLTYAIPPPLIKPTKAHPYSLAEAKASVIPQIVDAVLDIQSLPAAACPSDVAVAKINLHPAYIAKSYFPSALLRQADLTAIGSRTIRVRPRKDVRKTAPPECESTQLLVAGAREAFARLPSYAASLVVESKEGLQFAEIEQFSSMKAGDRIRPGGSETQGVYEIGLHFLPEEGVQSVRRAFSAYARKCDFEVNAEFDFPVGRMLFLAARGPASSLEALAQFSLLRVVRPMPQLRGIGTFARSAGVSVSFSLPNAKPLSEEPTVAILDGGLPESHVLEPYVGRCEKSDPNAEDVAGYVDHGLAVTSAFLFGPIEPSGEAQRPYSAVDHYRVLDELSGMEDPYELYRTLGHIENVLLSRRYQFLNLSLGPDLPTEDADVHAWTAVLDTVLSDGETLMTVAVGNNGERDSVNHLNRIQVPSDSVNAMSVGAANHSKPVWARAAYSACGPGRSPGRKKPDIVAFGGCPAEYFHVARPGNKPRLVATMGTSFAAPLALRTAVGVRAVLGEAVHPLTIKALLVHAAQNNSDEPATEVGWGRIPNNLNEIIMCGDSVARIIYQGLLRPGKYLRALLPLPAGPLEGRVRLSATFCYASPVDVEDAAAYTKAGLTITFRPNASKVQGKQIKSGSFFSPLVFRTEQEQRADLGKWETVLHASKGMLGSSLNKATFDIHYNARDGGAPVGAGTELIRYALVLTVKAPKHVRLYDEILATHKVLQPIEPRVVLPVRS